MRNAFLRLSCLFLVLIVAFVAVIIVLNKSEPVEFSSEQEVADHIADFYSIALDRQDITEGNFSLDVWPGETIVIRGSAPELITRVVPGKRSVEYSDGGRSITVSTTPDETVTNTSFSEVFGGITTSTLRILVGGEEIEVPVNLRVIVSRPRDVSEQALEQLLELGLHEKHEYVVRVLQTNDVFNRPHRYMDFVSDFMEYSQNGLLRFSDLSLLRDAIARWGPNSAGVFHIWSGHVETTYYELFNSNEERSELLNRENEAYNSGDHVLAHELYLEIARLSEDLWMEAMRLTMPSDWHTAVGELMEYLVFNIYVELMSVDGINLSR